MSVFRTQGWTNPDQSDPSTPFEVTIHPSELDAYGLYFFKNPMDPSKPLLFGLNYIKIKGISGQIEDLYLDLIGSYTYFKDIIPNLNHFYGKYSREANFIADYYLAGKKRFKKKRYDI